MQKEKITYSDHNQAKPAKVIPITSEAFLPCKETRIYWLGGAGIFLNIRGTTILIDALMDDFDLSLLFNNPLDVREIPDLDAFLVTHIDNDHFSRNTCHSLLPVCHSFHSTKYVSDEMRADQIPGTGHAIGEHFMIKQVNVSLTPTLHNWQNELEEFQYRIWKEDEYCGYMFETPDGRIWLPGDSRLLEDHLHMPVPDVILFDFSDNEWHITFEGAVKLANAYPDANLICIHWGTVDAPEMTPFNGNPETLASRVINPERIHVMYPGEAFSMSEKS